MAKSITINTSHEFTTGRGETETVADALAWVEKYMSGEDEDGESTGPAYTPADLIVYAVRRLRALHKDNKRHEKGVLASRLYAPRIDMVEKAPRGVVEAVATLDAIQDKLNGGKPEPKKAPAKKPAPKGSPARGAANKAKHEAKQARKATKADAGGAHVEF